MAAARKAIPIIRRWRRQRPARAVKAALAVRALAICALSAWAASGPATGAEDDDPGAIMRRVVALAAESNRDVVGYHSEEHLRVDGGLYHRTSAEMRWFVLNDGKVVATGLRQGSGPSFGKSAERDNHEPWGPYASEYTFTRAACEKCADGVVAIAFASTIHDDRHGSGVLTIDTDRGLVLHERLLPYDIGNFSTSAAIDIDFGETELGWRPRALHGEFAGRVGPFSGAAHLEDTLFDYRRYPTIEGAIAAVSS